MESALRKKTQGVFHKSLNVKHMRNTVQKGSEAGSRYQPDLIRLETSMFICMFAYNNMDISEYVYNLHNIIWNIASITTPEIRKRC